METNRIKLSFARAAILSIVLLFSGALSAQKKCRATGTEAVEITSVKTDINTINSQTAKVTDLKKKYKEDYKAGRKEMAIETKKEWRKGNAELKKERKVLVADVKSIEGDDGLAVHNAEKAVRQDKAELKKAKKDLNDARKRGDEAAIRFQESRVSSCAKMLDNDEGVLTCEKNRRSSDRDFMKKEIKDLLNDGHQWVYFEGL